MHVIHARNVHEAFALGLKYLRGPEMYRRESRNGPVIMAPGPVTTVYERPIERVLFWKERDANPFFHLYEALWMLAGRNDVAGPVRYAKNMANYSDDGETFHGAYGARWRNHFSEYDSIHQEWNPMDQLAHIAKTLRGDPEDRRCVLQMWDPSRDLSRQGKDLPCNLTATFQRDFEGKLDLTVFCRSNDIIWGAYGANAVHFSMLLEYMAFWIGCPVGKYYQVSVNWHAYTKILEKFKHWELSESDLNPEMNPYAYDALVKPVPMALSRREGGPGTIEDLNHQIRTILTRADENTLGCTPWHWVNPWALNIHAVLGAHEIYRRSDIGFQERMDWALAMLAQADATCDWIVAAKEWLVRRIERAAV